MPEFITRSLLLALLGCCTLSHAESTTPAAPASPALPAEEDPIALFYDVVYARLAVDGEVLLCEQGAYTACFKQDKTACISAQTPYKEACLAVFNNSRADGIDTGSQSPTYAFMQCMLGKQVAANPDNSSLTDCTAQAQKSFSASPYSKRIEVLYALELSNQQIDRDLCEQVTLFRCPADDEAACKNRINRSKDNCKAGVEQEILKAETVMDESQAAQQYMSCLLINNDCKN